MTGLASILIPCYNGARFLDRCMNSILLQTDYPALEVVLVNDGSTDETSERAQGWGERLKAAGIRFAYVFQENRGLGGAIDTGLKHITGDYLLLLDVDDVLLPGAISLKAEFLNQHPDYGMVRSNGYYVTEGHIDDQDRLFVTDPREKGNEWIFDDLIFGTTVNWAGSYMVRTGLLFQAYPDKNILPSRYGQNLQIMCPVAKQSKCGFVDVPLMKYIRQGESLSSSSDLEAAWHKQMDNQKGYRAIREWTVRQFVPAEEQERYMAGIRAYSAHAAFTIALCCENAAGVESVYRDLKKNGWLTLEERLLYARTKKGPVRLAHMVSLLPARIVGKLRRMVQTKAAPGGGKEP